MSEQLEALIGRVPDPVADRRALLAIRDARNAALRPLLDRLLAREEWRQMALEELFPGLRSIEAPFPPDRLGVRAANLMPRAGISTWAALAIETPDSLGGIYQLGPKTVAEILAMAASEWAATQLGPDAPATVHSEKSLRSHLSTISAWATATCEASGAVEAIVAAAGAEERLPRRVEDAMRALASFEAPGSGRRRRGLAQAFEELEETSSFYVFRRRRLDGPDRPTLAELGRELGVSGSRIGQKEEAAERTLAQRMREEDWPIRIAVERLRARLGALARPAELQEAFAALDRDGTSLCDAKPHRRALLLHLAAYRVTEEWILGPDVESLTDAVLAAAAAPESSGLRAVSYQLARLGIREELQLPWIVSRHGFRIIDGD